ncbi:MAG: DUF2178 domain-containing protein [Catenulisporales bacterium]|nr:DUF2178 domain-containing protein [Catenulisporales bacterium]
MTTGTERTEGRDGGGSRGERWAVPALGLAFGVAFPAILLARHDVPMAVTALAIMIAYVAVLVFGSKRWEAAAVLRGQTTDERRQAIDQQAAAMTLRVLALVLSGGYVVSLVRGTGESTWAALGAVLGGVYIGSTILLTRRG